jgi:hypothetical protein
MGNNTQANGSIATAMGFETRADGTASTALGWRSQAIGNYSTAFGFETEATGAYTTAIGRGIEVEGTNSLAIALNDQSGTILAQNNTMSVLGGNLGIGTTTPSEMLEVADTIYSTIGGFKFPDGTVQATAAIGGQPGNNTLDEAYDQGWSGAGRIITADAGAVVIAGVDGFLSTGTFGSGSIPVEGEGIRMMWYPNKGAFRVGRVINAGSTYWDSDSIGGYSFATGYNTRARAFYTTATGLNTRAYNTASTAMGDGTTASGNASMAMGDGTTASGNTSTAMGLQTEASGDYSLAIGREIEAGGENSVAIALSDQNGLTITQNNTMAIMGGKVGINESEPSAELHVGGTDGVLFSGSFGVGSIPFEGAGVRMMWHPAKAAFRVGEVQGTYWDEDSIGHYSVSLGYNTRATGWHTTALGEATWARYPNATAMGKGSRAIGNTSTAMGSYTTANSSYSTAMGQFTVAGGLASTVIGFRTQTSGNYSIAAGSYISTSGDGSFAIGDYSTTTTSSFSTDNQFNARFANGYNLYTSADLSSGATMASGANSWSSISDSTKKENFKNIDGEYVLNEISDLRLGSWNYIGQDPTQFRHYGPMAQEFFNAFGNDGIGVCGNDTTLASADVDGINMIAIQALENRTSDLKKENAQLKKEISLLKSKIEKFESLFSQVEELTNDNKKQYAKNEDNSK